MDIDIQQIKMELSTVPNRMGSATLRPQENGAAARCLKERIFASSGRQYSP